MKARSKQEDLVRLAEIEINGFRSCRTTTFLPNRELSALIGINGAGKTTILQAIRVLRAAKHRVIRRRAHQAEDAESEVIAWFHVGKRNTKRIGLKLRFSTADTTQGNSEISVLSEEWNLESVTGDRAWIPLPSLEYIRGQIFSDDEFSSFRGRIKLNDMKRDINTSFDLLNNDVVRNIVFSVSKFRDCITYYSASRFTDPAKCPSSFEVDEEGRPDRYSVQPHAKFLHDLYLLKKANHGLYEDYCQFVSRKQLGLINRITWKEIALSSSTAEVRSGGGVKKVKKQKTLIIPRIQTGSTYITFNQLSEGTFKTLALVFYIVTDSSELLMVEEPEVCVHHGLLSKIADTLKSCSATKQTIISTHSDLLVDALSAEDIFFVEMTSKGTQVNQLERRLADDAKEALHSYLAESGTLGEYWRSGGLS